MRDVRPSGYMKFTAAGGLLHVVLFAAPAAALDLAPELRQPDLDTAQPDIRRRPEEARTVTPRTRPRPDLDPLGLRIRSFLLFARADLRLGYNDNLFAREDQTDSDFYTVLMPRVDVRSDWSRHALKVGANFAGGRYQDFSRENYDDWRAFTEGRLDFGRASSVFGDASIASQHEDRASPDSTVGAEQTQYQVSEANLGWAHPFGRFEARLSGEWRDYEFDDVDVTGLPPGTLVGDDRNRQSLRGEGQLRYAVWPGYGVFVRAAHTTQDYDSVSPTGINRDSSGYEADVGLNLELTDLIFGSAYVGDYRQRYDESGCDDYKGLGFGADLFWNITRLSTLHLLARRSVQESVDPGASGYLSTDVGLELEHELLRNLLLVASGRYTGRQYDGSDRRETLWQSSFGANYLANRRLQLRLQLVHRQQDGSNGGRDFTQTFVEQTVVLQY
jgi:hypothetical protein